MKPQCVQSRNTSANFASNPGADKAPVTAVMSAKDFLMPREAPSPKDWEKQTRGTSSLV